ncbi:MAG: hypothetical protein WEB58_18765 [Planctomycetaceae bacterium]
MISATAPSMRSMLTASGPAVIGVRFVDCPGAGLVFCCEISVINWRAGSRRILQAAESTIVGWSVIWPQHGSGTFGSDAVLAPLRLQVVINRR